MLVQYNGITSYEIRAACAGAILRTIRVDGGSPLDVFEKVIQPIIERHTWNGSTDFRDIPPIQREAFQKEVRGIHPK